MPDEVVKSWSVVSHPQSSQVIERNTVPLRRFESGQRASFKRKCTTTIIVWIYLDLEKTFETRPYETRLS